MDFLRSRYSQSLALLLAILILVVGCREWGAIKKIAESSPSCKIILDSVDSTSQAYVKENKCSKEYLGTNFECDCAFCLEMSNNPSSIEEKNKEWHEVTCDIQFIKKCFNKYYCTHVISTSLEDVIKKCGLIKSSPLGLLPQNNKC